MTRDSSDDGTVAKPKIICREIGDGDLDAIAALLARGFSGRSRDFWLRGLNREKTRAVPDGYPRYGYMLDHDGRAIGVVLVLYAATARFGQPAIICNVGSWYVEDGFRGQGPRLLRAALNREEVVYTDTTPSVPTYTFVERLGFKRYCNGLFFSLPCLSRARTATAVEIVSPDTDIVSGLPPAESELLVAHARYGCLSLVCHTPLGPEPFIFVPFHMRQGKIPLPAMQLAYGRDIDSYRRCAGAIGRKLLRRGKPVVILDANAAISGLAGIYTEKRGRKYFRGPHTPSLTDLTNTELVLFGL